MGIEEDEIEKYAVIVANQRYLEIAKRIHHVYTGGLSDRLYTRRIFCLDRVRWNLGTCVGCVCERSRSKSTL